VIGEEELMRLYFRNDIAKHAKKLITLILESKLAQESGDYETEAIRNNEIEEYLSENTPFTMLMRNVANRYI